MFILCAVFLQWNSTTVGPTDLTHLLELAIAQNSKGISQREQWELIFKSGRQP